MDHIRTRPTRYCVGGAVWNFEPDRIGMRRHIVPLVAISLMSTSALAGPPFVTDDPQPTDDGRYEIYAFSAGTATGDGSSGQAGIDFNYGGAENLQLTMVLPFAYDQPNNGRAVTGFGEIELAAKYRFLRQDAFGIDVAFFPRLFLPTNTNNALGSGHASIFLPIYLQKDWGDWGAFGGGGCTINRGGASQDYCQMGLVLTRRLSPEFQIGLEVYHQTPENRGDRQSTGVGFGAIYDLSKHYHLMASVGPGVQNPSATNQASWYAAFLFTY